LQIGKDRTTLGEYVENAFYKTKNPNYYQLFGDIYSLEKYSRNDFKFEKEDDIKNYYPMGYGHLTRNKDYMGAFYLLAKDYAMDDFEAANYKAKRVSDLELALNTDFEEILNEGAEKGRERYRNIIDYTMRKASLVKEFKRSNISKYPILGNVNNWNEDVEMCQLYAGKTGMFNSVLKEYPKATNIDDLLVELNKLAPITEKYDMNFDKSVATLINEEDKITLTCTDAETNRTLVFFSNKYD
jgi:hypothetical protein